MKHKLDIIAIDTLYEATIRGSINWNMIDDDNRDAHIATIDGAVICIERLSITAIEDMGSCIKGIMRITGGPFYNSYFEGTEGYWKLRMIIDGNYSTVQDQMCKKFNRLIEIVKTM